MLIWSRSYSDSDREDWTGKDPDRPNCYARVHRAIAMPEPDQRWYWTFSDGTYNIGHGYVRTATEAKGLAEEAHRGWLARH